MFPEWHHAVPESAYFKVPETLKTFRMYSTSRYAPCATRLMSLMMNTIWRNCFSCEKLEELLNPGLWVNRLNVLVLIVNDCYLSNEEEETLFQQYNTGTATG